MLINYIGMLILCFFLININVQVELAYYDHGGILPYVTRKIAEQ